MPTIANLGNGDGVIYTTLADGTTVVATANNTPDMVIGVLIKAKVMKGVANHASLSGLSENTLRYFFNDDPAADFEDLSGSIEVTDWFVARGFEGLMPIDGNFSADGGAGGGTPNDITVKRKGSVQVLPIREAVDGVVNNIFRDDPNAYIANDILIVRSTSASIGVLFNDITLKDGVGNLVLNGDFSLNGENRYIMLRWDSFVSKWVEMFRNPAPFAPTVQEARGNGFSVNGDAHTSALITSGGGVVIDPNVKGRYVTLASPFPQTLNADFNVTVADAKAGDFYFVRIQGIYTPSGGDIRLFGTPITGTIIPANTDLTNPATVVCLYSGSSWQFFCVVDINRYALDFDDLRAIRYAKVTYDFAIQTGATGTYTIGDNVIPANSIVDLSNAIIVTKTALTSGGAAQVSVGIDGDADGVDGFRNFNSAPYNAVNASSKVNTTVASGSIFVSADADITFTISTAALTAGKVDIYVPYTKA